MVEITAKEYQKRRRKAGVAALEAAISKYTGVMGITIVPTPPDRKYGSIVDAVLMACDKEEDKICDELMEKVNKK